MKSRIKSFIKIYVIEILFVGILLTSYAIYLSNSNNDSNVIIELLIGVLSMLLLGMLYGNYFQKKGLIVGILVGVAHVLVLKMIIVLAGTSFSFNWLSCLIDIVACGLGGMLGIIFKKII